MSCRCGHCWRCERRVRATKHGLCGTRIYKIWKDMRRRCLSKSRDDYKHYGGRGITICRRWEDPRAFRKDMGDPPSLKHSIERIDVNGNYEPSNCRWATQKEQTNNMRKNVFVSWGGESLTLSQWSEKLGINYYTLRNRVGRLGWTLERAMTNKLERARI